MKLREKRIGEIYRCEWKFMGAFSKIEMNFTCLDNPKKIELVCKEVLTKIYTIYISIICIYNVVKIYKTLFTY